MSLSLSILLVYFNGALCAPVLPPELLKKVPSTFALKFMQSYGYLEAPSSDAQALYTEVALDGAIREVQRFGGLPETGHIDNRTLQLMQSARCGVPDIINKRHKRFALGTNKGWSKRKITYYLANWSPKIDQATIKLELQRAFNSWARYGRLQFQEVEHPDADIVVAFHRGYHGDGYPFDGPGMILAHAFFPYEMESYGGDIHFDNDEDWRINRGEFGDGVDFFSVAVHELGHSLGLAHSAMPESVMNPYYKQTSDSSAFTLGYDDILGMYELYINRHLDGDTVEQNTPDVDGKSTAEPETTVRSATGRYNFTFEGDFESVEVHKQHDKLHGIPGPVPPYTLDITGTTPSPDATSYGCDGNFDAVAVFRGELFIFKEKWLWRLSEPGQVFPSYPVEIHRMFHKLPPTVKKIDAAYQREKDSNILFFTGNKYWVFNGDDFVENSPRPITDLGLPDYLTHIDAVMIWSKNKKTYLFHGDRYWRYDDATSTMDQDYPKDIAMFQGVPYELDSAMTWKDGITYFFKGKNYWAFNNTWKTTEDGYPRSATKYLLNCSK